LPGCRAGDSFRKHVSDDKKTTLKKRRRRQQILKKQEGGGEKLHHLWSRACIVTVFASLAVAGCSGMGDTTLGGRPLIYKNAPSDEVVMKAGIPTRVDPNEPPPRRQENVAAARASGYSQPQASARALEPELQTRYTQAARYGDLLFLSGQIANDLRSGDFDTKQDIEAQTRRSLDNVRAILEANRLTMANIVSTTVYITNISRLAAVDAVYHDYFRGSPPARTVVEVSNLPRGALVEITAVAGR
jgi:2-iminobutanoate/2-iminopropanoate deaminase